MPDRPSKEAFDAGTTAIQTATEAAAAQEVARAADTAALLAKVEERLKEHNEENKKYLKDTMIDVWENIFAKEQSTYIVKNRVPLLCQDVANMKGSIRDMDLKLKLLLWLTGIVATSVILGLIGKLLKLI